MWLAVAETLQLLASGEVEALVVAKLDRLSRSLLDFAALMERAEAEGWAMITLDLGVDTSTPAGEMLVNVLASFAQYERRLIGQRTREGLAQKRAAGVQLGRPAVLLEKIQRRIVQGRRRGLSLRQIADVLNRDQVPTAHGGREWYASTVRGVLRRAAA